MPSWMPAGLSVISARPTPGSLLRMSDAPGSGGPLRGLPLMGADDASAFARVPALQIPQATQAPHMAAQAVQAVPGAHAAGRAADVIGDASGASGLKRNLSRTQSVRRKRPFFPPGKEEIDVPEGHFHARWLIESSLCAKVLGSGGRQIRHMKEITSESSLEVWISPKVTDAEYRIFNCIGPSLHVAKMAGLLVRAIFDEPENAPSEISSKRYDIKMLVPHAIMGKVLGQKMANFCEIENQSGASLSAEFDKLPESDERVVHVYGVADAVHIAMYYLVEVVLKSISSTSLSPKTVNFFDPRADNSHLSFRHGHMSDDIPRSRMHEGHHSRTSSTNSAGLAPLTSPAPQTPLAPGLATPRRYDEGILELPPLAADPRVPQNVYTAYDIAKDSQRKSLRQVVRIDPQRSGSEADRTTLVENITRTTSCKVQNAAGSAAGNEFAADPEGLALVIEGAPEENVLALFLIYRFIKSH